MPSALNANDQYTGKDHKEMNVLSIKKKNFKIPRDLNIVMNKLIRRSPENVVLYFVCILDQIVHSYMLQVFCHKTNKVSILNVFT